MPQTRASTHGKSSIEAVGSGNRDEIERESRDESYDDEYDCDCDIFRSRLPLRSHSNLYFCHDDPEDFVVQAARVGRSGGTSSRKCKRKPNTNAHKKKRSGSGDKNNKWMTVYSTRHIRAKESLRESVRSRSKTA